MNDLYTIRHAVAAAYWTSNPGCGPYPCRAHGDIGCTGCIGASLLAAAYISRHGFIPDDEGSHVPDFDEIDRMRASGQLSGHGTAP